MRWGDGSYLHAHFGLYSCKVIACLTRLKRKKRQGNLCFSTVRPSLHTRIQKESTADAGWVDVPLTTALVDQGHK